MPACTEHISWELRVKSSMIIKTTIIYLYGPSCREDREIIEWSPSIHPSLRPPPSAAEIQVQQLKERYHRHKDKSHCWAYWISRQKWYV